MHSGIDRIRSELAGNTDGGPLIEFAIAAPVLFVLLFGLLDFGRIMYDAMALETSARSGAHYAGHRPDDLSGIETAARQATALNPDTLSIVASTFCECPSGTVIGCSLTCPDGRSARYVRVMVQRPVQTLLPWPGMEEGTVLRGSAELRVQ